MFKESRSDLRFDLFSRQLETLQLSGCLNNGARYVYKNVLSTNRKSYARNSVLTSNWTLSALSRSNRDLYKLQNLNSVGPCGLGL